MPKVEIEVRGIAELQRKLNGRELHWQPVRRALNDLGKQAAAAAKAGAPRGSTGDLSAGMTHKLNAVPMPLWVAVTTNVVGKSGRRYPWILEFEGKYGHKNWLKNAISRVQAAAGGVLQRAVGEIEAKWRG